VSGFKGAVVTLLLMTSANELFADVMKLPADQRADLVLRILASFEPLPDADLDALWAAELERRAGAVDRDAVATSDWDVLRQRVERELLGR
jgi:putative addiction module component (TIGR02574 family)